MLYPIGFLLHLSDVIDMFPRLNCPNLQQEMKRLLRTIHSYGHFFFNGYKRNAIVIVVTVVLNRIEKHTS